MILLFAEGEIKQLTDIGMLLLNKIYFIEVYFHQIFFI